MSVPLSCITSRIWGSGLNTGNELNHRFRLQNESTFRHVRRYGRSYTHTLLILIVAKNDLINSRFGIAVGRKIGGAVTRNHVKRRARAILTQLLPEIEPGWDIILIAREPILRAQFNEMDTAVRELLTEAELSPDKAIE